MSDCWWKTKAGQECVLIVGFLVKSAVIGVLVFFVCLFVFFQGLWVMLSASQRRKIFHILPVPARVCVLPYTAHSLCSLTPMAI